MKLIVVVLVALCIDAMLGILVTAVLTSGKKEDELRDKLWKEYEEGKNKE